MSRRLYWLGNAAKSRVIDEILSSSQERRDTTVFDYGCGDGGDWPAVLADHPQLRLLGYEPHAPSCRRARERLHGEAAEILTGADVDTLDLKADYIVSYSVFEHVVHRADFLRRGKRILAPHGVFYLNYDDGHFRNFLDLSRPATWLPALRAWGHTVVSRPLAALGIQSHYQGRVDADEVDRLVAEAGFDVVRVDYHNLTCLKSLAKTIPAKDRQRYASWWLETEKYLNEQFLVHLAEKHMGDCRNLWQQMLSRTLYLRHHTADVDPIVNDSLGQM